MGAIGPQRLFQVHTDVSMSVPRASHERSAHIRQRDAPSCGFSVAPTEMSLSSHDLHFQSFSSRSLYLPSSTLMATKSTALHVCRPVCLPPQAQSRMQSMGWTTLWGSPVPRTAPTPSNRWDGPWPILNRMLLDEFDSWRARVRVRERVYVCERVCLFVCVLA